MFRSNYLFFYLCCFDRDPLSVYRSPASSFFPAATPSIKSISSFCEYSKSYPLISINTSIAWTPILLLPSIIA